MLFIFLVCGFVISIMPIIGPMIFRLILFCYLVLLLWGTIGALAGKAVRIPVISDLAAKITL